MHGTGVPRRQDVDRFPDRDGYGRVGIRTAFLVSDVVEPLARCADRAEEALGTPEGIASARTLSEESDLVQDKREGGRIGIGWAPFA